MSGNDQMRAALGRRTTEELLHAYFLGDLSESGRRVVTELVETRVGPIDALVAGFARQQGEVVARVRVRSCHVDATVDEHTRPLMRGVLVLTTAGAGFVPRARDEDGVAELGRAAGLAGKLVGSILSQMRQTAQPVPDLSKVALPVPLLAHVEPTAVWLPRARYDAALWSATSGELVYAGTRLISLDTLTDAKATVAAWAASQGVDFTSVAGSPLLR